MKIGTATHPHTATMFYNVAEARTTATILTNLSPVGVTYHVIEYSDTTWILERRSFVEVREG